MHGTINTSLHQPPSNWNMDSGYFERMTMKSYPRHTYSSEIHTSLTILMRVHQNDIDHLCGGGVQGFSVSLHPPNEGPNKLRKVFIVSLEKSMLLTVDPKVVEIPSDIRKFRPDIRRCYLTNERVLRFYKQYTRHNCEHECLSNFTFSQCRCVGFSMPRKKFILK